MSDPTSNVPNRKPQQKPVFIIEPFNAADPEHMKGNMNLVLNKRFATDLSNFIRESEITENEGHFLAIQGNIQRWYKSRYNHIKKLKEGISPDEAQAILEAQVPEEIKNLPVTFKPL